MASPTQPAQNLETQTAAPSSQVVRIRVTAWIREMASLRGMTEAAYLNDIARADYADFRSKKFCATPGPGKNESYLPPEGVYGTNGHRNVAPSEIEKLRIVRLRREHRLTIKQIAARLRRSPNTVVEVLRENTDTGGEQ